MDKLGCGHWELKKGSDPAGKRQPRQGVACTPVPRPVNNELRNGRVAKSRQFFFKITAASAVVRGDGS